MAQEAASGARIRPKIWADSVYKSYMVDGKREQVLNGVQLTVNTGELVSIIGPSGCGKSTLLNIIAGLDRPDAGTVELDGDRDGDRLGKVGYMQQKDLLLPWRTVLDNATLGLELQGVSRSHARSRALELTTLFGLKGFEYQYPFALSGGMRQRAAFLRTMLLNQDVVLLDEPFGALDALTRVQMQEWLMELWNALKKTIILITHDVEEAILLSDRIYVLSVRPAGIKMVIDVDLPRPRNSKNVTDPDFIQLKSRLLALLHTES
jgi:ABC-type nitrate/sulfonate/bicarbonate transport system ATPase subunit